MGGGRNKKREHAQLGVSLVYDKYTSARLSKDPKVFFIVNKRRLHGHVGNRQC